MTTRKVSHSQSDERLMKAINIDYEIHQDSSFSVHGGGPAIRGSCKLGDSGGYRCRTQQPSRWNS